MLHTAAIDIEFLASDTEGQYTVTPLSIGLVAPHEELYLELSTMTPDQAAAIYSQTHGSDWFAKNVRPGLGKGAKPISCREAARKIESFLYRNMIHQVVGFAPYQDFCCLIAVFGGYMEIPDVLRKGIQDLKIEAEGTGLRMNGVTHNALDDARATLDLYKRLENYV